MSCLGRLFAALRPVAGALLVALAAPGASAATIDTAAPYAVLVDYDTDTVLFEKEADTPMAPASMSKLMTMAVVFEELRQGRVSLDDEFQISEKAWRTGGAASGGSTMFAPLNSSVKLRDLIRGVIIQSANDACIAIAEGMYGSEEGFVQQMNRRAKEIGLTKSRFKNTTGLPDPEHRMTARDLATLARHIIEVYPEHYKLYSEPEFTWNKVRQQNRNPLLSQNIGVDGLKTGHTSESGYGLVSSAVRNGQRLILVVNGLNSMRARAEESRRLLDWGFRAFERIVLYSEGEKVTEARVFGGEKGGVALAARGNIAVLVPKGETKDFRARVVYDGPVPAPVKQGQAIGRLQVSNGGTVVMERELYAAEAVEMGSMPQRAFDAVTELVLGLL